MMGLLRGQELERDHDLPRGWVKKKVNSGAIRIKGRELTWGSLRSQPNQPLATIFTTWHSKDKVGAHSLSATRITSTNN